MPPETVRTSQTRPFDFFDGRGKIDITVEQAKELAEILADLALDVQSQNRVPTMNFFEHHGFRGVNPYDLFNDPQYRKSIRTRLLLFVAKEGKNSSESLRRNGGPPVPSPSVTPDVRARLGANLEPSPPATRRPFHVGETQPHILLDEKEAREFLGFLSPFRWGGAANVVQEAALTAKLRPYAGHPESIARYMLHHAELLCRRLETFLQSSTLADSTPIPARPAPVHSPAAIVSPPARQKARPDPPSPLPQPERLQMEDLEEEEEEEEPEAEVDDAEDKIEENPKTSPPTVDSPIEKPKRRRVQKAGRPRAAPTGPAPSRGPPTVRRTTFAQAADAYAERMREMTFLDPQDEQDAAYAVLARKNAQNRILGLHEQGMLELAGQDGRPVFRLKDPDSPLVDYIYLWSRVLEDEDRAPQVLAQTYHRLVWHAVRSFSVIGLPTSEVRQTANDALLIAADTFRPRAGRFVDHAVRAIRGAVKKLYAVR